VKFKERRNWQSLGNLCQRCIGFSFNGLKPKENYSSVTSATTLGFSSLDAGALTPTALKIDGIFPATLEAADS
jgi:hypothetical protein